MTSFEGLLKIVDANIWQNWVWINSDHVLNGDLLNDEGNVVRTFNKVKA